MTTDRLTVVSADTHAGADVQGYRAYLTGDLHDDFDRWAATFSTPWRDADDPDIVLNWESDRRLAVLEADGIAAEVVFPNTYPPFFPSQSLAGTLPASGDEYRRRWAGLRAHNRWLVDFCAAVPGRRRGVIQVLPNDIDDAVAEIRWASRQEHLCGVLLPSVPPNTLEPLYTARYDPLWAACLDAGLPVVTHAGGGAPTLPDEHPATMPILVYEYGFWSHRTVWHLVFGGVFDRFPDLRFVITEQGGCKWLGGLATALDRKYETLVDPAKQTVRLDAGGVSGLRRRPSEYLADNCWLGASFLQPHDAPHRHDVCLDHVMWGSDFPHLEGTTPFSREALRATLAAVPVDEIRSIVGGAAVALYGFDGDRLDAVAATIGPTVDEITTPLDRVPDGATSYAFHEEYQATY